MAFNMSLEKTKMPNQDANIRNKNFSEVALGYTDEMAINEAKRCLNCKNPKCVSGCPVNINVPEFIKYVSEGMFKEAYEVIYKSSSLPAVCGRVCPQEKQCEEQCVRGIKGEPVGIGYLERFIADWYMNNVSKPECTIESNGIKVAVVGSGPSGLSCASDLAKLGYDVTIFEALHLAGGVLVYGIPEFRLPKSIVEKEINLLKQLGVKIETNIVIGKTITINELFDEYNFKAAFVGSGAGLPKFMGIPGENLNGVYSANEFLTRINLMKAYDKCSNTPLKIGKNVCVVGGGNVAMDAARSAIRIGAENVYIIYRRGFDELPARIEEVHHAQEEGIIFKLLTNPVEIIGDEKRNVVAIDCVEMILGEPDESGRRRPIVKENSLHRIEVDSVIMSVGTTPNPLIKNTTEGLNTEKWGGIIVNEENATSIEGIYAGGDAVTGAATVILAMGAGKKAAKSIHKYLTK